MIENKQVKQIILDMFREETLLLSGLFTVYEVPDDFIWRVMKNLDILVQNAMRQIDNHDQTTDNPIRAPRAGSPHPAVAEFYNELKKY